MIKRIFTLCLIALVAATAAGAQTYNADDVAALKRTLLAENNPGLLDEVWVSMNSDLVKILKPDAGNAYDSKWNNENWVPYIVGLTWTDVTEGKELIYLYWHNKGLEGELIIEGFSNMTSMSVEHNNLTGLYINDIPKLNYLCCNNNQLTTLDVSRLTELTEFRCRKNELTTLNISGLTKLAYLFCDENKLTTLDVSVTKSLKELNCSRNEFATLDVSEMTELTHLKCYENKLTTLNVSGLTKLKSLECNENQLSILDVSGLEKLYRLYCFDNQLSTLDISELAELKYLECNENQLSILDVSELENLYMLYCSNNQLSTLDVSGLTELSYLECNENQLSTLDVSGLENLYRLNCSNNKLSTLDVSGLNYLGTLYCSNNQLSTLGLPKHEYFYLLDCSYNQLSTLETSGLFEWGEEVYCQENFLPFKHIPQLKDLEYGFYYSPQKTLNYPVYAGNTPDLSDFLVSGETTKYKAAGMDDFEELTTDIVLPVLEVGETWKVEFKNSYFTDFDDNPLQAVFTGVEPPVDPVYHTVTLEAAPGIDLYNLTAGKLTIEDGGHLYLQFLPEGPTATATDILFLVDGVETAFKDFGGSHYFSYILSPVTKDHTIAITLRETGPTGNVGIAGGKVSIAVESGGLRVESDRPVDVAVYALSGQLHTTRHIPAGTTQIALPAGVYIVRAGETTQKVMVND